mgnify:CR=1 FL=1
MKKLFFLPLTVLCLFSLAQNKKTGKNFFELRVYEYKTDKQQDMIDQYLKDAFMPYMQSKGVHKIGVFAAITNDTAAVKKMYVLVPYKSLAQIPELHRGLMADKMVAEKGAEYINATMDAPAYTRIVNYILEGFRFAPTLMLPKLNSPMEEHIYELRSYEGPSEKKYLNKVEMFNEGGETDIFSRLNFNPVFYAETISGPTMPNLIYMTSFENMKDRDAHWAAFKDDAQWKALLARKEFDKTVSKNVTLFLKARPYSDY